MPQCHNPKLSEGKLMSVLTLTDSSRRNLEAIQRLDKKKEEFHMSIANRHHVIWTNRIQRMRNRLQDSLKRTEAYKSVICHNSFSKVKDLNRSYTYKSMRHDIHNTLERMDPAYIRAQKTKVEIDKARRIQQNVMDSNIETAKASFRFEAIQEAIAFAKQQKEKQEFDKLVYGTLRSVPPISKTNRPGTDNQESYQTENDLVTGFAGKPKKATHKKKKGLLRNRLPPLGTIQDVLYEKDSPRDPLH